MDLGADASACERDKELIEEFATATEAYYTALKRVRRAEGYQETRQAQEAAEVARMQCASAREAVERHRKEHGCKRMKFPATNA